MQQIGSEGTTVATRVRFQIVGWAAMMSLLLYLDRYCISICTNYIRQDMNVSTEMVSLLSSAFFLSYALCQVPSGWLTDRYGVRMMLTWFILGWSLCTGLQAFAGSFWILAALQLGCGVAQAGAYPAGARLIGIWCPPTDRGVGSAIVALGGRFGGALAPLLTAWLLIQFVSPRVDSLITERTELHPTAIGAKLVPAEESTQAPRLAYLWDRTNAEDRSWLNELATLHGQKAKANMEQKQQLRDLLNSWLDEPTLYRAELFEEVIEKEGRKLGEKQAREGRLQANELRRLNRLTLESAFPKDLGNIYVHGWRPSMLVYGVAGIVVAYLFWRQVRDTPTEDSRCNDAERYLILGQIPTAKPTISPGLDQFPWRAMLTSSSLWGNCMMQFTTNVAWLFLVRNMPQYLEEVHGVPLLMRGWMTSVPIWAGLTVLFFGGRLTDRLGQRFGVKWGRRLPILLTRFTAMLGFLICIVCSWLVPREHQPSWMPWVYVAALSVVAVSVDIGVPSVWAFAQDVGGKYTASVLGWGNMWGNFGAMLATPFYAWILGKSAGLWEWNLLFGCLCGMLLLSAVGTLMMDSSQPLVAGKNASARGLGTSEPEA